jgi:amino acid adenylation domain-containing protein
MDQLLAPIDRSSGRDVFCLPDLVEAQALRAPERPAVIYKEKQLRYGELNSAANQLARYLRTLGVGRNALVGICLERSHELVTAVLGVLKAGGAYVPLDPDHPRERVAAMLKDAGAKVLLTDSRVAAWLSPQCEHVVRLDRDFSLITRLSAGKLPRDGAPEDLAYVMYTSGSTGRPKGVMLSHGNLSCLASLFSKRLEIGADDGSLLLASISFAASVRQYLIPLSCGARVVVASKEELGDPLALMSLVKRHQVTLLQLVPPHLRTVLAALAQLEPQRRSELLSNHLRFVLTASEVLTPDVAAAWLELEHPATLVNMYGLTESTGPFMLHPVQKTDLGANIPIGRPMEGADFYLLDDDMQPVAAGTSGELYLAGPTIARGYRNQQQLTDEKFVPDPFGREPGRRMFKTGDRVRINHDGNCELLGRLDDEIKIRGFKVVPNEIRGTLGQHPLIAETIVVGSESAHGEKRLLAAIVAKPGATLRLPDLRRFLRDRVPEHMVPSIFVKLDALPMLPNGKIDRLALSAFHEAAPLVETEYVAPATTIEEMLAEIWGSAFQIKQVGTQDNYFELGGDSLKAMEVLLEIRAKCGVEIELETIFEAPTIGELARIITSVADAG